MALDIDLKQLQKILRGLMWMKYDDFCNAVYEGRKDYVSEHTFGRFERSPVKAFLELDEGAQERLLRGILKK